MTEPEKKDSAAEAQGKSSTTDTGDAGSATDAGNKDSRMWATFCHLAALSAYVGVPLGHIIGPLVVWLIKKDEYPFVERCGKEALNFQISVTIYGFVAGMLCFLLIGIPLVFALIIAHVVLTIMASIKVNKGEAYRYPCTIRFIS